MTYRYYMKLKKERIRPISEEDPLKLFHAANKSPSTDKEYTDMLYWLLGDVMDEVLHGTFEERVKEFVEIGRNEPEKMMGILFGLSEVMRERTKQGKKDADYLNPSSVPIYFNSIKKLLTENDISVNWKRVNNTFPERDNVIDTQGWTLEEIRLMLDHSKNARNRALILTMASSGVRREGSLLRWGDLTRIYYVGGRMVKEEDLQGRASGEPACVAVNVYRRTAQEYVTFITPEAYQAIMDYAVEWEAAVGRKPRDDDPIFKRRTRLLNGLHVGGVYTIIRTMASSAGVWTRHPNDRRLGKTPASNGFRRFFNKTLKDTVSHESPVSTLTKIEYMMGHKGLLQIDPSYYQTNQQELASIYVNGIPNLTISESERSRYADRRSNAAMPGLNKQDDGRIRRLDDMSRPECLELLEGMLAYGRSRNLAGSVSPA